MLWLILWNCKTILITNILSHLYCGITVINNIFLLYTGYIVCCICCVHVSLYYLLSNQSKNDINNIEKHRLKNIIKCNLFLRIGFNGFKLTWTESWSHVCACYKLFFIFIFSSRTLHWSISTTLGKRYPSVKGIFKFVQLKDNDLFQWEIIAT